MIQNPNFKNINQKDIPQNIIKYSQKDDDTWNYLCRTQLENLQNLAHPNILKYLEEFSLPKQNVPQLGEFSDKLHKKTGWKISRVEDLIDSYSFFHLLANKIFPSTVYIRTDQNIFLSKDPDIFHELFGHCPILLDINNAKIFEKFGLMGLQLDKDQRQFLQRLFWFTFETGLINTVCGLKIYGGSLVSSIKESSYSLRNDNVVRKPFDIVQIFRTPYRADILQGIDYVIDDFSQLYTMLDNIDLIKERIDMAYSLGEFSPYFPVEKEYEKYMNYNLCKSTNDFS